MSAAAKAASDEGQETAPISERMQIFQNCQAVFNQVQQYDTPPDPVTYAIWYAYVTHTPTPVRQAMDKLIASGRALDSYELNEIYSAHLKPSDDDGSNETIGREIEDNLESVSRLLESGIAQNTQFRSTLDDIQEPPGGSAEIEDFQNMVSHLISESQKMSVASMRLTDGLRKSQERVRELTDELEKARQQSLIDPLTNVANRRAFEERLNWQIGDAKDSRGSFCLVLADLDEFKKVNDNLGHQSGDAVLRAFAKTLFEHTKGSDLVARYGGDEFGVILPDIEISKAYNLMVSVKHKFEELRAATSQFHAATTKATASFGIAPFKSKRSADDLVAAADMALNRAKSLGRNRVCAEGFA